MKKTMRVPSLLLLAAILVVACGGTESTPGAVVEAVGAGAPADERISDDTMENDGTEATANMSSTDGPADAGSSEAVADLGNSEPTMDKESDGAAKAGGDTDGVMAGEDPGALGQEVQTDLPSWFSAELIDVRTGEAFSIADLQGKVVLVGTMAIWCSNCLKQQREVKALHEILGDQPNLVTVVLDIDPNESADILGNYADNNDFDWTYAVAPRDVAREIGQLYGDQFLNPPSTPMLIIDRYSEVHPLPFGIKSADSLENALKPFLIDSM